MPGAGLEVVTLDAAVTDPLVSILEQVRNGNDGAVMVTGLERAISTGSPDSRVLRALNLGRANWPESLRRPVVIWIPGSTLGALGRSAPDFLDWRSDTFHFPDRPEGTEALLLSAFDDVAWQGGLDTWLPERDRRARIEELLSRLQTTTTEPDPVIASTRARWLHEVGNHHLFLGEYVLAEDAYCKSLAIFEKLGDPAGMAGSYHQLVNIFYLRGLYEKALEWCLKALAIEKKMGDRAGMADSYQQLGMLDQQRSSYEEALEWYRKSLAIQEEFDNRAGMAISYHQLGNVAYLRSSHEEALEWYRKSLAILEELGNRAGMASSFGQIGMVAQERGSYEEALEWYRKSLVIDEELGNRAGMATSLSEIGGLLTETGRPEEAIPWNLRSLAIRLEIGVPQVGLDLHWLTRQREALEEGRFGEILRENLDEEAAAAVLRMLEDSPGQE